MTRFLKHSIGFHRQLAFFFIALIAVVAPMRCDTAQGSLISRPLDQAAIERWLGSCGWSVATA